MKIKTEHIDATEKLNNQNIAISRLAFTKHLGIAGQGYAPKLNKLQRIVGMFFLFRTYMRRNDFYKNDRFSQPPIRFSDPTEKGQFSNLAGKAIADFMSKRINKSILTVNYEAAMKIKGFAIKGSRPDLIAYTNSNKFAIECKGFDSSSPGNMTNHKNQSKAGPISVNFSVASVSYNLYNNVKCNFHDPINSNAEYDEELLKQLSQEYYSGLKEYYDERYFERNEIEVNGESFYEIEIFTPRLLRSFGFDNSPWIYSEIEFFFFHRLGLKLILPKRIEEFASNGISRQIEPFLMGDNQTNYIYIDNDRVGLKIENGM